MIVRFLRLPCSSSGNNQAQVFEILPETHLCRIQVQETANPFAFRVCEKGKNIIYQVKSFADVTWYHISLSNNLRYAYFNS